jgi:hypothetical protein
MPANCCGTRPASSTHMHAWRRMHRWRPLARAGSQLNCNPAAACALRQLSVQNWNVAPHALSAGACCFTTSMWGPAWLAASPPTARPTAGESVWCVACRVCSSAR